MDGNLFPFASYWWLYAAASVLLLLLLGLDLIFHRKDHVIRMREAALWTAVWAALAVAFAGALYWFAAARFDGETARRLSFEFLAGYLVEESLSVDNMFVFALIFRAFAVPGHLQHRVLFYGVLGAIVCRGVFISLGAALVEFHWVLIGFGIFLIYTGVKLAFSSSEPTDPRNSPVLHWVRRWVPLTEELHGNRFFVRVNGARHATPLLVVLLILETTDVVFAVDSVPAVFGVTREPLIVFTSNLFAILGLRSLYFLLAGAMRRFYALQYGLAAILVFVGLKMAWLDGQWGGRFPIGISLAVICVSLAVAVGVSLLRPRVAE